MRDTRGKFCLHTRGPYPSILPRAALLGPYALRQLAPNQRPKSGKMLVVRVVFSSFPDALLFCRLALKEASASPCTETEAWPGKSDSRILRQPVAAVAGKELSRGTAKSKVQHSTQTDTRAMDRACCRRRMVAAKRGREDNG